MEFKKTEKNIIKRGTKKANYNKEEIYSILDTSVICNIAFLANGCPQVQPINFGRRGNKIFIHGSMKNRMLNILIESKKVCLNAFHLDSMKLARSACDHSVNFRSVVIFGEVKELLKEDEKIYGLKTIINHFIPNRWENCRKPNANELKATRVLEIEIETASAKIANSAVDNSLEDEGLDFWSGEIPIKTICKFPVNKNNAKDEADLPQHIFDFYQQRKNGF